MCPITVRGCTTHRRNPRRTGTGPGDTERTRERSEVGACARTNEKSTPTSVGPFRPASGWRDRTLSRAEERELARQVEEGRRAEMLLEAGVPWFDRLELAELEEAVARAEEARSVFVEANQRLVFAVARRYVAYSGMDLADLAQEGNLGLLRAIERFDYRKGFKFSTYAVWWIRQAITRAIGDKAWPIRVPAHLAALFSKVYHARWKLENVSGKEPNTGDLSRATGIPEEQLEQVVTAYEAVSAMDSLEAVVEAEASGSHVPFEDLWEDEEVPSRSPYRPDATPYCWVCDPEEEAIRGVERGELLRLLDHLSERDKLVVVLRFGLDGKGQRTLAEIGQVFGLTRERIRQIEEIALEKLRAILLAGNEDALEASPQDPLGKDPADRRTTAVSDPARP